MSEIGPKGEKEVREYPPHQAAELSFRPFPGEVYSPNALFNYFWSRLDLSEKQADTLAKALIYNEHFRLQIAEAISIENRLGRDQGIVILETLRDNLDAFPEEEP